MSLLNRRSFIIGGAIASATLARGVYDLKNTTTDLEVISQTINSRKVPKSFDNYKIGFISDIHYGESMSEEFLENSLKTLAKHSPNLCLLGGDYQFIPHSSTAKLCRIVRNKRFYNQSEKKLPKLIVNELADFIRANLNPPDGIFACLGNHDHWHNLKYSVNAFSQRDIVTLINQAHIIKRGVDKLVVGGVDDYLTGFPRLPSELRTLIPLEDPTSFTILLNHNPDFLIRWLRKFNTLPANLTLGGHTHGGQVRVPNLGLTPCNIEDIKFISGLIKVNDDYSYTSKGLGVVEIPVRISCPPDITILTLRST